MGSNLVVAAVPDENDRVWKLSSEKIPHLTLLFLGETSKVANLDQIMQFVGHAASTTLKRFYLPVDRRGELGDDKADVLFFKKGRYDYKHVRDFRASLLQDTNIKTAYDSAEQFDGWLPHLTLGYPETPAKPDESEGDYRVYDVCFNKIAVWTGDYEGVEYLLKDWDEFEALDAVPMDVAMSDLVTTNEARVAAGLEAIEHYGTKGMRWGVRQVRGSDVAGRSRANPDFQKEEGRKQGHDTAMVALGVLAPVVAPFAVPAAIRTVKRTSRDRDDAKFERVAKSQQTFVEIHNGAVNKMNRDIASINKKYQEVDLTKDPAKQKTYDDEVFASMRESYRQSANSLTNKRADKHLDLEFKPNGLDFAIKVKNGPPRPMEDKVQHADTNEEITLQGKLKRAKTGHILGFDVEGLDTESMSQTVDLGGAFIHSLLESDELEHYGVKGMRWGQRKPPPVAVPTSAMSHVPQGTKRKTKIKVEGGENHPASDDAIKVAQSRVKLAKSGPKALSNRELQEVANRAELEARVKRAVQPAGRKFVTNLLKGQGQESAQFLLREQAKERGLVGNKKK